MAFDDLSPQQQEFCRKYLKYSSISSSKEKKKRAEINAEYEKYLRLKERVLQSIKSLQPNDTMGPAYLKRVGANEETLTGKGKSTQKLAEANKALVVIQSDVEKHMAMEENSKKQVSPEGQIRNLANVAQREILAALEKVEQVKDTVLTKLTKLTEGTGIVIASPAQWIEAQLLVRNSVAALSDLSKPGANTVEQARVKIATILTGFKTEATRLTTEIETLGNDDTALRARGEAEKACAKLRDDLDTADTVIEELIRWGNARASEMEKNSSRLRKLATPVHPDLLTSTTTDIAALLQTTNDLRQEQLSTYTRESAPLLKRMEVLNTTVTNYNADVKAKRAAQLPQVQEASFLVTMSYNAYAAGKNVSGLPGIIKMVDDAEKLMFDLGNSQAINGEIIKAISLADATLKKNEGKSAVRKEAWKGHREALTKFEADWTDMRPATARGKVSDLVLAINEEVRIEAAMKLWRETQLRRVEASRTELAKLEKALKQIVEANGEKFKGYEGTLKVDLDTCVEWINTKEALSWQKPTETKIGQTQTKIMEMLNNLSGSGTDPADPKKTGAELKLEAQKGLIDDHDASVKAKSEAEVKKKAFLEIAEGWVVISERDAKASPRAKDYKEEVARLFKQVADLIKNVEKGTQDVEAGKRSLDLFNKQFEDLLKRPAKINHKALAAMGTIWADAVRAFGVKVSALVKAVRDNMPADPPEQATAAKDAADKLEQQLQLVNSGFATAAFGEAAKVLGNENTAMDDRKRAREVAQAAVRDMRAKLMNDPLIKACVANPFAVNGFGSDIYLALNQIELETLRGI
ncbi:MAG: hypothetical protein ACOH2H_00265 [Cypionkella sp.]